IIDRYKNAGKVLFCGNGGSAADAQHMAAELSGRYYYDRPPLFAEALHVNTSFLTAVANDYSFEEVYARLVKAMGNKGDILIGLSTSGNSKNVINAMNQARILGMVTAGFTGIGGGEMKDYCDILLDVPSNDTPRIQECHISIGHSICELVERGIFPK
ncbi:MAG: D-sedoheptulose 7-phosphate isomerase, partial [Bacteroidales bacterium]|nr:D-sedoheptulose 7-phosphate isomerase [Bacteroidales bacterium]